MDEKKKLINWTAGISTVIVALLIIIVVMEPRGERCVPGGGFQGHRPYSGG